jgi:hypothetical protein
LITPEKKREESFMILPEVVTPEGLDPGSSQNFAWIPAKGMRE